MNFQKWELFSAHLAYVEGLFTHWKKRTRFFSEQKDLYGFLMDFS